MMKNLYIIRGIKLGQTANEADIGMNNIIAMGKYGSVKSAKRYLKWEYCRTIGYDRKYFYIGLFDMLGPIMSVECLPQEPIKL
jgi:hypothetical protein